MTHGGALWKRSADAPALNPHGRQREEKFAWDAPHGTPSTERQAGEMRFKVRTCQTFSLSLSCITASSVDLLSTHYAVSVPQQLVRVCVHHRVKISAHTQGYFIYFL